MTDTSDQQTEQAHTGEEPDAERLAPEGQADFEELKEATKHFFNTLVRVGMHLTTTPVPQLPGESREHFANAARELTRGFSTLAHQIANTVEKVSEEVNLHEHTDA